MNHPSEWVLVARILRPQGRKGEVLSDLFTDFPERFETDAQVWLAPNGFTAGPEGGVTSGPERLQPAHISAHWLPVGRNAGRIVLHFTGISTIEQAQTLAGREVVIAASQRLPLEDGAAYISDMLGAAVFDGSERIGVVQNVEFATTADGARRLEDAAPLLNVLSPEGDEILVPFVSAYMVEMDLAAGVIRMALPDGLVSANKDSPRENDDVPGSAKPVRVPKSGRRTRY